MFYNWFLKHQTWSNERWHFSEPLSCSQLKIQTSKLCQVSEWNLQEGHQSPCFCLLPSSSPQLLLYQPPRSSTRFVKPLKREFEYSGPPSYNELFTCIKHWTLHQIDYHWGVQYHQIQWGRLCFHLLKGEEVMCNSGRRNLYVPFHLQRGQTSKLHMGGLPYALVIILRMVIMLW